MLGGRISFLYPFLNPWLGHLQQRRSIRIYDKFYRIQESLQENKDSKKQLSLSVSLPGLMKSGVVERCDRTKGAGWSATHWDEHSKPVPSYFAFCPLVFGDKDAPLPLGIEKATFTWRLKMCFRGRSESPSLEMVNMPLHHILRDCILNSVTSKDPSYPSFPLKLILPACKHSTI